MASPAPHNEHLEPGTRLGRYQVQQLLALGGMAEIYLAQAFGLHGFKKQVVLKRVPPHFADNEQFVSMFLDEARLAAQLQHPNIAQVYDIGADEASCFFAMEYIDGKNLVQLQRRLRKTKLSIPLPQALAIVLNTAAGLHAAHEHRAPDGSRLGVVHRDVSPANVLVTFDGCIKLIDFGIAKAAARQTHTRTGVIKGKYAYMSPEQCRGKKLDRRSDVFSLGVVMFELTTQTRLFSGSNQYSVMRKLLKQDLPRPSERRAGYPEELERIVMKALSRDRDKRYRSAQALHRDLDEFVRGAGLSTSQYDLADYMATLFPRRAQTKQEAPPPRAESTGIVPRGEIVRSTRASTIAEHPFSIEFAEEVGGEVFVPDDDEPTGEHPPAPTHVQAAGSDRIRVEIEMDVDEFAPDEELDSTATQMPPTRTFSRQVTLEKNNTALSGPLLTPSSDELAEDLDATTELAEGSYRPGKRLSPERVAGDDAIGIDVASEAVALAAARSRMVSVPNVFMFVLLLVSVWLISSGNLPY